MVAQTQKTLIMVTLKETANEVLKSIYNDDRINTVEYTELKALEELKNAIEFLIQKRKNKFSYLTK